MQVGNNWGGNYSRFTYDEAKRYFYMMKEQGVPVLDEEFNLLQEMQITYLRRFIQDVIGNGSTNNGFRIVGAGVDNDFIIMGGNGTVEGAGHFYIGGYLVVLPADTRYSTQPIAQPALTTPAVNRTDTVYLDVYLDEMSPVDDSSMVDPTLNVETSRRLQLKWAIKVAENATVAPVAYTDANGLPHFTQAVAIMTRGSRPLITVRMVRDIRRVARAFHGNREGGTLHAAATQQANGFMSAGDKSKLDSINVNNIITRSRRIDTTPPLFGGGSLFANRQLGILPASPTSAGSMSAADKLKANAIYSGHISENAARGFNYLPRGWVVSRGAAGVYNLTHNLGTTQSFSTRYASIVASPTQQNVNNVVVFATQITGNIAQFIVEDTAGNRKDNALNFIIVVSEHARTNVIS